MTRQVGSELASIYQQGTQLAIEALHQFRSALLELAITAAAVAKIADGDAVDELATGIELGDVSVNLARIKGETRRVTNRTIARRGGARGVTVTCLQLAWRMIAAARSIRLRRREPSPPLAPPARRGSVSWRSLPNLGRKYGMLPLRAVTGGGQSRALD
jgi:hypothetical protein